MLELLARYARDAEAGFGPKYARWALVFDSRTGFSTVVELGQADQKNNRGQLFSKCPALSQPELIFGSETRSHFLVESAGVVALYRVDTEDTRTAEKHGYFVNLLAEAGQTMPALATVAGWLKRKETLAAIQSTLAESKARPTDKVTFRLDGRFPVEEDYWHDWWRTFRKSLKRGCESTERSALMRCFVSGDSALPATTHYKIEGLSGVGGRPSGDVLVGFDKEAFGSYGLQQSANAAVSEEAMACYCNGLNELIRDHSQRLVNARVVHWFKGKVSQSEDPFQWLSEPPELTELSAQHRARQLLRSIGTGERPDLGGNYYYALTLSGAGGRAMIRDWMEGRFEELAMNIMLWFRDLEITRRDGSASVGNPKFFAVLGSLVRTLDELPPPVVTKLWRVAVRGEVIPYAVLVQTLTRRKTEIIQPDKKPISAIGMGLIKAYHARKYRKEGNSNMADKLNPILNEDFPSIAYQCGRLLAVLGELQRSALGDVGAGVVQRYYAAASTTPALVLGRLTRTSQFHLNKLDRGLAYWYESKLASIWGQLSDAPPRTLSLEEQSLFALGYYQQLADMRAKKSTEDKNRKEEGNA